MQSAKQTTQEAFNFDQTPVLRMVKPSNDQRKRDDIDLTWDEVEFLIRCWPEGLDFDTIAQLIGMPTDSVRHIEEVGRRKLKKRRALEEFTHDETNAWEGMAWEAR